jgi:hypothetical protein
LKSSAPRAGKQPARGAVSTAVSFLPHAVSNLPGACFSSANNGCSRNVFSPEFFELKLSVSWTTNVVDGEKVDLYIRATLPDAGREAA